MSGADIFGRSAESGADLRSTPGISAAPAIMASRMQPRFGDGACATIRRRRAGVTSTMARGHSGRRRRSRLGPSFDAKSLRPTIVPIQINHGGRTSAVPRAP